MIKRRTALALAASVAIGFTAATPALADTYPSKPVRIVVI
ncbi:MAG: tripartite tricarboxylate transporter substrate binding protein, partial [Comamonadaceae bacterium]